jgi:hypothetical protein
MCGGSWTGWRIEARDGGGQREQGEAAVDPTKISEAVGTPIQNFGVAVGMLVILLMFFGVGMYWVATRILQPWIQRHFLFLDGLISQLSAMSKTMVELAHNMEILQLKLQTYFAASPDEEGPGHARPDRRG